MGVITIETYSYMEMGLSLTSLWERVGEEGHKHYGLFMHDAARFNPEIVFVEIDPRDSSKVKLDNNLNNDFPELPDEYLQAYLNFLSQVNPQLALDFLSDNRFFNSALQALSVSDQGIHKRRVSFFERGVKYHPYPYVDKEENTTLRHTGLELGAHIFADAIMALKLRRLAQLQKIGKLPPGPIFDLEGASHIHGKRLFFDNPIKAFEVVALNLQLAHQGDIFQDYDNLDNWDDVDVIMEILDILRTGYHNYRVWVSESAETAYQEISKNGLSKKFLNMIENDTALKSAIMDIRSNRRTKELAKAFSIERLHQTFDPSFWEKVPQDAFEIHLAKPNQTGGLDTYGLDFSGSRIK